MKTAKEFFERLQTDKAFAEEVAKLLEERLQEGTIGFEDWIYAAKETGYELSQQELEEFSAKKAQELSEEDLGKAAGGTTPAISAITIFTLDVVTTIGFTIYESIKG